MGIIPGRETTHLALHTDLPPLLTLRAFEAVARHLSFINAAAELSLTQSALSHQIQKLELHLGRPLFVRRTRAIDLTETGALYYAEIRPALETIARATVGARAPATKTSVLRVGLLASFATLWLAPRLADFINSHPHIQVELLPSIQFANFVSGDVDLAIRYGKGSWPNVRSRRLMTERISPVCSPAFKANNQGIGPILMTSSPSPFEWNDWAKHAEVDLRAFNRLMLYDYNIVVEAAIAGQGLAMGRQHMIARKLEEGTLVEAFDIPAYEGDIGYWLIQPSSSNNVAAACFEEWLIKVCADA